MEIVPPLLKIFSVTGILLQFFVLFSNCADDVNEPSSVPDILIKILAPHRLETQSDADLLCISQGKELFEDKRSQLLSINDHDEQELIQQYLFQYNKIVDHVWLGLKEVNGEYLWNDKTPAEFTNWAQHSEPHKDKECVEMDPQGFWLQVECKRRNMVVCEAVREKRIDEGECKPVDCQTIEDLKNNYEKMLFSLETQIDEMHKEIRFLKSDQSKNTNPTWEEMLKRLSDLERGTTDENKRIKNSIKRWQEGCGESHNNPLVKKMNDSEMAEIFADMLAGYGEFPWQIAVFADEKRVCSATLISHNWALADATCFEQRNVDEYTLRFGEFDILNENEDVPVVERSIEKVYRDIRKTKDTYDYGLVMLLFDAVPYAKNVQHICLPEEKMVKYNELMGTIIGWQDSSEEDFYEELTDLLKMEVNITDWLTCQSLIAVAQTANKISELLTENHICALMEGKNAVCSKDSGSPLAVKGKDGKWRVVGIAVDAAGCRLENYPAIYHNVGKYEEWILTTLINTDVSNFHPNIK